MFLNEDVAIEDSSVTDVFASYFGSVYLSSTVASPTLDNGYIIRISDIIINIGEIYTKLNSLELNKGPGADGIPSKFIQSCSDFQSLLKGRIFSILL